MFFGPPFLQCCRCSNHLRICGIEGHAPAIPGGAGRRPEHAHPQARCKFSWLKRLKGLCSDTAISGGVGSHCGGHLLLMVSCCCVHSQGVKIAWRGTVYRQRRLLQCLCTLLDALQGSGWGVLGGGL